MADKDVKVTEVARDEDAALVGAPEDGVTRHQRRQRLLMRELRKLRYTFTRMRDIA